MATTYDKASLVMIPSGVKESKLYSIKPTDGSGDFTFSRGTDTATRVNASGLIEKERSNQLLQSNTFDTTWLTNFISLSGGQSGYDGSNDAWEMTDTRASGDGTWIYQNISQTGVLNFSFYAKAGTQSFLRCLIIGTGGATLWVDLTDGTISNETDVISSSATSVGGDWYRISFSGNVTASAVRIQMADGAGSSSSTLGATTYIQDAQLESGLVATDYIETTTAAVYEGITDNLPRLDYSGGASCPSLLLEPSRSNLLPYSEYLSASNWTKTNVAITDNATTSPEGVDNAVQITENASGLNLYGPSDTLVGSASAYTFSAFLKQGSLRYGGIRAIVNGFANRFFINVDLQEGTITDTDTTGTGVTWSYDIEAYADGWYRVWISATNTSGNIDLAIGLSNSATPTFASGLPYYTGTGSDYIYTYGAQVEAGSYPTSYIPTYGTAASRARDEADITSASALIGSEGVMFIEMQGFENGGASRRCSLSDGSNDNRVMIEFDETNNFIRGFVAESGTTIGITASPYDHTNNNKVALKYTASEIKIFVNGVLADSDSLSGSPIGMDKIRLYQSASAARWIEGFVKQFLVFPTALTDAECIALTTI